MAGRPRPLRAARVGHGDRDATAVLIVEGQRVVLELVIEDRADVKGMAARGPDDQDEAVAFLIERAEVGSLNRVASQGVWVGHHGLA